MTSTRARTWIGIVALTLAIGALAVGSASAADNGKRQGGDGDLGMLTALWWQWVLEAPTMDVGDTNTNPVLDTTGEYATYGQEDGQGPGNRYFFLAGTFGFPVERTVTVPHGKALFFPVVNWEWDNAWDPPTNWTVPQLRAIVKPLVDEAELETDKSATLDGEDLEILRLKSPTFSYTMPDENSLYDYFGAVGPQYEGTITPVVADGLWVYVAPLAPGEYVLHFTYGGFQDNTYYLTVE